MQTINLKTTALVVRKSEDGKLLIFGSSLDVPVEIVDDQEYLFVGELILKPKHVFHEYQFDKGNSPNELLNAKKNNGGALNHKNYKNKIL